jgi:cell division septation protein DedD
MKSHGGLHVRVAAALLLAGSVLSAPALADVRSGVDAWSRGDYAGAVAQWQGPAASGDADAMFNLGQAYRLGRGVAQDPARAEELYRRAAEAGHVHAADTYGLMLFQNGRQQEALPFVQDAARRGDPRSQYLLGIAHFNGDLMPRDWVRAYALLTLANASGLPQAAGAIAEMDSHIAMTDRQRATVLASQLRAEAVAARDAELAAADLGTPAVASAGGNTAASPRVPQPIPTTAVSPSVASARSAIAEARVATGTASPSDAGATFSLAPSATPRAAGAAPTSTPAPAPAPAVASATQPAAAPRAQASASGPWRVQLGAFSVRENAERLWNRVSGRAELAGHPRMMVPAGRVTRLLAGGFASQSAAQAACNALARSGIECLVTRN